MLQTKVSKMKKKLWLAAAIIVIVLISVAVAVSYWQKPTVPYTSAFAKGVTLSPRSFDSADFSEFFQKARQAGTLVSWAGDWNELNVAGSSPDVISQLASQYDYTPLVEAQFFSQSTGKLLRSLDEATKASYKNKAVGFASTYKPRYLALGIEVNVLCEKSPNDFYAFAQFFSEVYDAVKAVSPNTNVFTIFQLEKMKGLNGGLFGGENNLTNTQWSLLDSFPKSDFVAFTTYPCLVLKNPAEIPANYYAEIKQHTTKPIAFTEIGWHSNPSPTDWESSEGEQAEFVTAFFELTKDVDKNMAIWSFLYDQDTIEPFNSMGLLGTEGNAKAAWDSWTGEK